MNLGRQDIGKGRGSAQGHAGFTKSSGHIGGTGFGKTRGHRNRQWNLRVATDLGDRQSASNWMWDGTHTLDPFGPPALGGLWPDDFLKLLLNKTSAACPKSGSLENTAKTRSRPWLWLVSWWAAPSLLAHAETGVPVSAGTPCGPLSACSGGVSCTHLQGEQETGRPASLEPTDLPACPSLQAEVCSQPGCLSAPQAPPTTHRWFVLGPGHADVCSWRQHRGDPSACPVCVASE